ncbi:lymphocyte antigen 6E-like [Grus japonensis]|uniref:Lymphocyte antigen 6E-like n=1 Tax=Grus japonensis TaxID=30415 RepID=A0ABC9W907_GRUJA
MKASLLAVVALILCADQANALYCYTCDWEQSNWRCLKAEKCSDKDEYCVTNVASVGIVSSLFCYTCDNEHSNWNCLKTYKCEDHEKYCTTTYSSAGLGKDRSQRITKKCSAFCPTIDLNIGIAGVATSCCETSLCNISGASSVKTSFTMIALGILASLACILRLGF